MGARKRHSNQIISKHDHVGNMHYYDNYSFCLECEQEWKFGEFGWEPVWGSCLAGHGIDARQIQGERYRKNNGNRKTKS